MSSDADISACYAVMGQLRPQIPAEQFVARVRSQMGDGYQLLAAIAHGRVAANGPWKPGGLLSPTVPVDRGTPLCQDGGAGKPARVLPMRSEVQ